MRGFTLVEVIIALGLFASFAAAYISSQTMAVGDSTEMNFELKLHSLAANKINELIIAPPPYGDSLTRTTIAEAFDAPNADYSFEIKYFKIEIPDFAQLFQLSQQDENQSGVDNFFSKQREKSQNQQGPMNMIFAELKRNVEEILWQIEVTVIHNPSGRQTALQSWVVNSEVPVQLNFNF